jgi:putative ABC transport system permease protein
MGDTMLIDPEIELGTRRMSPDIDGKTVTVAVGGETLTLEAVGSRDVPAGTALVSGADAKDSRCGRRRRRGRADLGEDRR